MSAVRRSVAFLRSRKLAVWLLVGITAYVALLTVLRIPLPYSNPLFVIAAAALILSTAACAWERTSRAWRALKPAGTGESRTARGPSTFAISLEPDEADVDVLESAAKALRRRRMRVFVESGRLAARSRSLGHAGSPLFHWGLVALFTLAAAGQLMIAQGQMDVVTGGRMSDAKESYVPGSPVGPLFLDRYTGLDIGVEDIAVGYRAAGAERGYVPLVTVSRGGTVLKRGRVYPNSPLAYGSLSIHRESTGPAVMVAFTFPNGQEVADVPVFLHQGSEGSAARGTLDVTSEAGAAYTIEFRQGAGRDVVARVSPDFESAPLATGAETRLPDGTRLRVTGFTAFARLRVVNDWTLPYIFAAFVVITLGAALPLFWSPREVIVLDARDDRLEVTVRHAKVDPAFRWRVEAWLRDAVLPASREGGEA